jgi:hypothetical protein
LHLVCGCGPGGVYNVVVILLSGHAARDIERGCRVLAFGGLTGHRAQCGDVLVPTPRIAAQSLR